MRADHSRKGSVSVSTFKAALAAECKSGGFDIKCDEVLWFTEKLRGRDGRTVKILKMRALLEDEETGGHRPLSGKRRQVERQHHRNTTRRNSTSRRGESRGDGLTENGVGQAGNGGKTTSESDNSSRGGATRTLPWRSSPPPPARWAIRHGTVGQWLHEVAAPMVSGERACLFVNLYFRAFPPSLQASSLKTITASWRHFQEARSKDQNRFDAGSFGDVGQQSLHTYNT